MDADVKRVLAGYGKRISALEQAAGISQKKEIATAPKKEKKHRERPDISFTQVITVLGIIGIIVGVISFFFYAVANRWIGETGQVLIGIVVGFVLAALAYFVRERKQVWSNIVFGGAYAIEYIAIGVGVSVYEVMPQVIGITLAAALCISALLLAWKFESRTITYFAVVGGFLIPFLTGTFESQLFSLSLYVILSLALVVLSMKFHWGDVRLVSFIIAAIYLLIFTFIADEQWVMVLFLALIFVLHHAASVINSLRDNKPIDSIILIFLPVFFFSLLYPILDWPLTQYGLLVLVAALIQLGEIYLLKAKINRASLLTLIATGVVLINLGIFFFLNQISMKYYLVLFVVQQGLFAYLANNSQDKFYRVTSYLFLALTAMWTLGVAFDRSPIPEATALLIVSAVATTSFYLQYKHNIDYYVAAASFIISGFLTILIFAGYLELFMSSKAAQIILSVLWLAYTIFLYTQATTTKGKGLVGTLLGITLIKIAFIDLLALSGVYRIIGFIIFGILLLVGGFLIKK
tara:strand:+ start:610 stop:2169 length:1560 start_codon:yes stop_codon:yes gene_type:complete